MCTACLQPEAECLLRSSEYVSILRAGQAYSGSIDNWHQFLYVFHQHPIK